ncbi:MAG: hypothetical protein ABSB35_08660 [Bryobacteraceae bacterium]
MLSLKITHFIVAVTALVVVWPAAGAESTFKAHVQHAKAALLKKDLKKAGRELRAAGEYLGKAGASAPAAAKEGLEASAKEMRTLAEGVEKGTVTDVKRIDEASARGYHALANEKFVTATEAWTKTDTKATGRALKGAADDLEDGATAAGKDAGDASKDVAKRTREIAGKLVQGGGWTSEEVGRGIDAFGRELANLGRRTGSKL